MEPRATKSRAEKKNQWTENRKEKDEMLDMRTWGDIEGLGYAEDSTMK